MLKPIKHFFTTKSGNIVIMQFPNTPLIVVGMLFVFAYFAPPPITRFLNLSAYGTLLYWSYLEIKSGVNLWRKFLGAVVCIYTVVQIWLQLH